MSAKDWDKLRDKFFNECVEKRVVKDNGLPVDYHQWINIAPHDLFEWFKGELCEGKKQPSTESKCNKHGVTNSYSMNDAEYKLFKESGSKTLRFDNTGIGRKISYMNDKGKWIDITDYNCW